MPIISKTPLGEKEEEITDISEYKINIDNKNLIVKLGKLKNSQKVIFIIEEPNSFRNYRYKSSFSLDELKQLSKLFRIFDSIDEAYNEFDHIFKDNKISIKEEESEINLHLQLTNISSKTEDICLKIIKENIKSEEINDLIIKELNEIKELLKEEKIKNEDLNNKVNELLEEKQKHKDLENKVNDLLEEKQKMKN